MIREMLRWWPALILLLLQALAPLDALQRDDGATKVASALWRAEELFLEKRSRVNYTAENDVALSDLLDLYRLDLSRSSLIRLNENLKISADPDQEFILRRGQTIELFVQAQVPG